MTDDVLGHLFLPKVFLKVLSYSLWIAYGNEWDRKEGAAIADLDTEKPRRSTGSFELDNPAYHDFIMGQCVEGVPCI